MEKESIIEIGIDTLERLYLKPLKKSFSLIYRTATEVHWDSVNRFLYSPKPREWSYYDWYLHIINVAKSECDCELFLNEETKWVNIPKDLKNQILKTPTL